MTATVRHELKIQMIPIENITIVNARARGQSKFRQIVTNISRIGLKKPITVARRASKSGEPSYDLVCGQGRLEAFIALGQREVPAMVIEADQVDLFLMSLAENLARKQRTSIEFAREIESLHDRGNTIAEIAAKVDLDPSYIRGIIRLLKKGEERLLRAVEERQIPLSMAIEIAESDDLEVQRLMSEAYEKNELRGRALLAARRLLEKRRSKGKELYSRKGGEKPLPADSLVKVYKKEAARVRMLVKRAEITETRIQFIVTAFKKLMRDDTFVGLVRGEALAGMPKYLFDQVKA